MRALPFRLLTVALALVLCRPASGQYLDTQVLQKSFERTDFFFRPGWMNPYGLGSFGRSAAGFLRDPLVELQLGPSRAGADTAAAELVYLDFRSTTERRSPDRVYPLYAAELDAARMVDYYPYPVYYREARRLAEPVIAAAAFLRPLPTALPALSVGLTYEAMVDDQDYYRIPQDVYRSVPGADFTGERVADATMPITDIYGAENAMHTSGHFPALYAVLGLDGGWRIGVRAAFAIFDRSGSAGSLLDQTRTTTEWSSLNRHLEERDQRYVHRDLSFGLERTFGQTTAGVSVGYLDGEARQHLARGDSSFYAWGAVPTEPGEGNWSRYWSGGATSSRWREDGGTTHGGVFVRHTSPEGRVVTATWRVERQSVDLAVASALRDSSNSVGRSGNNQDRWANDHSSRLLDVRSGSGERTGTAHRASLAFEWPLRPGSRLTIGAVLDVDRTTTATSEDVEAYRSLSWRYEYNGNVDRRSERVVEDKTMEWDFRARRSAIRIPVLFTHQFTPVIGMLVGITREMAEWRIEDETLARIASRTTTINGQTEVRTNFGERYREPVEQRTDVNTDVLLGVTVTPADRFDVRLLLMPSWQDDGYGASVRQYRWWLGLTFRP